MNDFFTAIRRFLAEYLPDQRCCSPDTIDRPLALARSQAARTLRTPGASTATGFSMKTCLPASMAAWRWIGRNPGGVARRTTSAASMTCL